MEKYEYSSYLFGGKKRILIKIEKNIRETFPALHIVGRYPGGFRPQEEPVIPSQKVFELGLEWIGYTMQSPIKLFRFFSLGAYCVFLCRAHSNGVNQDEILDYNAGAVVFSHHRGGIINKCRASAYNQQDGQKKI
ncbi:MAG: WecB/TagA/CpsF family glycosyltransferase [Treponema sp.]|nr:WecB/TagA/CpsF family glycosyltransferase [Treponema sp.]